MALPVISWPLTNPWVRLLIVQGAATALEYLQNFLDGAEVNEPETMPAWRRAQVVFNHRFSAEVNADDAICTFDILKFDSENLRGDWDESDFTAVEARINTFLTAVVNRIPDFYERGGIRWYFRQFNPLTIAEPFAPSGPPVRVVPGTGTYTGTSVIAPQVAFGITERTAARRHWGRFYLPVSNAMLQTGGRFGASGPPSVVTAAGAMVEGLFSDGFLLVVPVTSDHKQPVRALLTVSELAADDVPDIIRRRRPKNVLTRWTAP